MKFISLAIQKALPAAAALVSASLLFSGCGTATPANLDLSGNSADASNSTSNTSSVSGSGSASSGAPSSGALSIATPSGNVSGTTVSITNVSYDPTRELYESYDTLFAAYWKNKTGQTVNVTVSNGGSGAQARSVLEGNDADVVTLAVQSDIDELANAGLLNTDWMTELPNDSTPYTSTIVLLVRKGNPKNIQDWGDLVKPGVDVITPDPKSSGGARWNFLAAWAYADKQNNGDETKDEAFMKALYGNVSVLDSGARASTTTFVTSKKGDVLIAWENDAYLAMKENPGQFELINPSMSILAQPPVAVVNANAKKDGTEAVSEAYLQYLYSDDAQRLEGQNFYRPSNPDILKEFSGTFDLSMPLVSINDFGGWAAATPKFFADGAIFDQIYQK